MPLYENKASKWIQGYGRATAMPPVLELNSIYKKT